MTARRFCRRPDGALLAGACAGLARRFGWNVWAVRALAVVGLFVDALTTGLVYGAIALLQSCLLKRREAPADQARLSAPELGARYRRIAALERRFRELEKDAGP